MWGQIIAALITAAASAYSASRPKPGPTGGGGGGTSFTPTATRLADVLNKAKDMDMDLGSKQKQGAGGGQLPQSTRTLSPTPQPSGSQPTPPTMAGTPVYRPPEAEPTTGVTRFQQEPAHASLGAAAPDAQAPMSADQPSGRIGGARQLLTPLTLFGAEMRTPIAERRPPYDVPEAILPVAPPIENSGGSTGGGGPVIPWGPSGNVMQEKAGSSGGGIDWLQLAQLASQVGTAASTPPSPGPTGGPGSTNYNPTVPTSRERLMQLLARRSRYGR